MTSKFPIVLFQFFLQDTKSSNGTYVNNVQLGRSGDESDPQEVKSGDIVQFGVDVVENSRKGKHHVQNFRYLQNAAPQFQRAFHILRCLFWRICHGNAGFSFRNSQNCPRITENLSKTAKPVEVGTSEN